MASKTYALILAGTVAELLVLDAEFDPTKAFGSTATLVDVTATTPTPTAGMLATEASGVWSFAAAPAAAVAPVVPQQITIFQAKAALLANAGAESGKTLLDDVNAWVATQSALMQLAWSEATSVTRAGSFVATAAGHFGWSAAFVDQLFTAGAAIAV